MCVCVCVYNGRKQLTQSHCIAVSIPLPSLLFIPQQWLQMRQVSNYPSQPVPGVRASWRGLAGPELAVILLSPHGEWVLPWKLAIVSWRVPRKINADSASLFPSSPVLYSLPLFGTTPRGAGWLAPWCHIMKCHLTWYKQALGADGHCGQVCFWVVASVHWLE